MAVEKLALLRWIENRSLRRYLRGRGAEVGALWRRFPVPAGARVWYVDRLGEKGLAEQYPELAGKILPADLLADAERLPFAPRSLDFLIASHVLEHLRRPLAALRSWYDVLARGGVLLLVVPDKRYTFDRNRGRTPLAHLLHEQAEAGGFADREHYEDWVAKVGGLVPGTAVFEHTVEDLIRKDYSIHFHVWIDEDIREMLEFTRSEWRFEWDAVVFRSARVYRKETAVLLRRR